MITVYIFIDNKLKIFNLTKIEFTSTQIKYIESSL